MSNQTIKPDWLRTSEVGSFAENTIKQRKPEIIRRILKDNAFSFEIRDNLINFQKEIQSGAAPKPIVEVSLDTFLWNSALVEFKPASWLDLPWYFAEVFFYRKVLEATGYYRPNSDFYLRDPFHVQKANQMEIDLDSIIDSSWLFDADSNVRTLDRLLLAALWGNRADLSHMDVDLSSPALDLEGGDHLEMLLNDLPEVKRYFSKGKKTVAYLTDNVGRELYSDLALIEYLLANDLAENITVMAKPAPLFVSDAMRKDVDLALQLMQQSDSDVLIAFVERVQHLINNGRLVVLEEPSLCRYQMFDEMPLDFYRTMAAFDLTIVKGDANYRRVIGDRHWDFTSSIQSKVDYFPTSLLLLRTLKSEVVVGLSSEQIEKLNRKYENWLVKGFCGVVQLVQKD